MSNDNSPSTLPKYESTDSETYDGVCHCGTVQYSVTLSPPLAKQKVVSCNCSICSRNGYLLVYPQREQFSMQNGEENLRTYTFGRKQNLHKFCASCGSSVFFDPRMMESGDGPPDLLGVNVRMFKNVKLHELEIVHHDGRNKFPFIGDSAHLQ